MRGNPRRSLPHPHLPPAPQPRQAAQQLTPRLSFVRPYLLRMPLFDVLARIARAALAPLPLAPACSI